MKYNKIKKKFILFFLKKKHKFFKSLPIVNKDKNKLLFINSGINQFKKIFLGEKKINYTRIVNIQKCIRITGKHNDLNLVGKDTYHHTLFEMLGTWSIGSYNIKKAIKYAWELITKVYKIPKKNIYVTVFKGDKKKGLKKDIITYKYWTKFINKKKILFFGYKYNFWKINNFSLCGPSTEIHIDTRFNKKKYYNVNPYKFINKNNKNFIELWNLVNIKYLINKEKITKNKKILSDNYIDTGMGLERLCMILQHKKSTYDTDIFKSLISKIEKILNIKYKTNKYYDILIRIITDHIRSIFIIMYNNIIPTSNKYGYVLRKLIRRCLIYTYKYLNIKKIFLYKLILIVNKIFFYKKKNKKIIKIKSLLKNEEIFFFKSLNNNIKLMKKYLNNILIKKNIVDDKDIMQIYSTYGINYFIIKKYCKKNNFKIVKFEKINKLIEL